MDASLGVCHNMDCMLCSVIIRPVTLTYHIIYCILYTVYYTVYSEQFTLIIICYHYYSASVHKHNAHTYIIAVALTTLPLTTLPLTTLPLLCEYGEFVCRCCCSCPARWYCITIVVGYATRWFSAEWCPARWWRCWHTCARAHSRARTRTYKHACTPTPTHSYSVTSSTLIPYLTAVPTRARSSTH